ncbi:CCCH zinc finger DNA binding protein [Aspergillus taichungensis]|uniref:CCCH zinc finger DNA binding protein n=1 Tax=Aspergillus taichungensis TaxID=482145 RepID=A0A2J5I5P4_9EURO|nr:CCCH zinc finger DNA binding protein [Aspergillus taichungensis]
MLDIDDMKQRYEDICSVEKTKDDIIQCLFSRIDALQNELQKEKDGVDSDKKHITLLNKENRRIENDLHCMRREQAKLSFVSVLVDGDGMNFREQYVQGGQTGGHDAARRLIQAVEAHLQGVDPGAPSNIRYRVYVYANVEGLTKAYHDAEVLTADESLTSFIQGFNKADELCNFVDAGNGKECADVKLRAHFKQNIVDVHCRRIVFCASADNGYARILGPHRGLKHISLVKGPPFAHEMKELAADFETTSFDDIFLSSKLRPNRRVSFGSQVQHTFLTPPQTPTPNYASAAKSTPTPPPPTSSTHPLSPRPSRASLPVCLNVRGQRVDRPVQYSSKGNVDSLKRKKMCNRYHLLGSCPYGDSCTHKHGPALKSQDLTDLAYLARLLPCYNDLYCRDVECISGHCCPRDNCSDPGCRFPDSMHSVDTTIVMNA